MDEPRSIALATRRGREIPNEQVPDLSPFKAEALVSMHKRDYGFAEMRRRHTGQYNCHGLTFANRRTGIYDPSIVGLILQEDGYREIGISEVQAGDIAVYYDGEEIEHTGIVIDVVNVEGILARRVPRLMSKWGSAAEYIHMVTEGPYSQCQIRYRTDRP